MNLFILFVQKTIVYIFIGLLFFWLLLFPLVLLCFIFIYKFKMETCVYMYMLRDFLSLSFVVSVLVKNVAM